MPGETIADAMGRGGGRAGGFDQLRLGLAVAVIAWHSVLLTTPGLALGRGERSIVALILPMFFALSGFLVAGSLERAGTMHGFLLMRVLRIVPALAVETLLSALLIGATFTTLPWARYLAAPQTAAYLGNMVGMVHLSLPGVFAANPVTLVNGSLWTLPFELECYGAVLLLWIMGVVGRRWPLLGAALLLQLLIPAREMLAHGGLPAVQVVPGRELLLCFLFGAVLHAWGDAVRLRAGWAVAALLAALFCLADPAASWLAPLPVAYLTIFIGTRPLPPLPLIGTADYSYGLYLYAYPIQQALVATLPSSERHWWAVLPLALILAGACALFSWHMVERRVLRLRRPLLLLADGLVDRMRDGFAAPPGGARAAA